MPRRDIDRDPNNRALGEDWEGNNAAFQCQLCSKVFVVTDNPITPSSHEARGVRRCPSCQKSVGHVHRGPGQDDGYAYIEW
jgi:hypothetical protein